VKHNLAHSYCLPISVEDLESQSKDAGGDTVSSVFSRPLSYGSSMKGSENLRSKISNLYTDESSSLLPPNNILITPGASLANFLVFFALVGPGDHAIVQYPTYQQLYSIPASIGAEVSLWKAKADDNWKLDLEKLTRLIQPNTKMIVLW
jgi:aspartate/methionine/tyrosine aminotransferase